MSDPQINIEIEDVLASIRRLVSEGEAPRAPAKVASVPVQRDESNEPEAVDVAATAPVETANSPVAPEKLVLSPEQMVVLPAAQVEPIEDAEPLLLTPDVISDPEAEPMDGHEEAPATVEDEPEKLAVPEMDAQAEEAAPVVESPAIEMWHSVRSNPSGVPVGGDASVERSALLSTIAELEAAVQDTSDDFEPDGSEETPVVDWAETTANGAIFGARAATTRIADVAATVPELNEPVDPQPVAEPESTPTQDIIAEAIIGDEAESIVSRLDDDLVKYLEAETTVDEEALREMVRDVVRQELQGALGERITRNVRKLVRREIYRVLNSEEFN